MHPHHQCYSSVDTGPQRLLGNWAAPACLPPTAAALPQALSTASVTREAGSNPASVTHQASLTLLLTCLLT